MASDIEQILYPTLLASLREDIPPVQCMIWKGKQEYEKITFEQVYPFDTLDHIKHMICNHYKGNSAFLPRFTFVGVPLEEAAYSEKPPTMDTTYIPLDYLWYPMGTNDARATYVLKHPEYTLTHPDMRFVSADGSYASPTYEVRGRSTIEQVFLKPREGKIPVLHVFPLQTLLEEYKGQLSEEDWNKRFAPYFRYVNAEGPYEATAEDIEFGKKINYFISHQTRLLNSLNDLLEQGVEVPVIKVTGIQQLALIWKKPVRGFEGSASLFYRIKVTDKRPYMRLLPAEGSAVTKLHVKGILPIPTLDDPHVLEVWGKEISPTPGIDFCNIKYIHRPAIDITPPIYGTIRISNDGTMNLLLQPPKNVRTLHPILDFRNFTTIVDDVFHDLPQSFSTFQLKEIAVLFSLKTSVKSKKFNKFRIQQRLPYFSTFFKEINPLANDQTMISLRYKAVSQYASEDKIFTFITQLATEKIMDGESADANMIDALQNEFQFSKQEATNKLAEWFKKRGEFTVQIPEEGEFIENFNPGIDIHIYAQHPSYHFHIHRIDSFETYLRIYTVLSLLFVEEDGYFVNAATNQRHANMTNIENEIEEKSLNTEEVKQDYTGVINDPFAEEEVKADTASNVSVKGNMVPNWINDPFADEAVDVGEVLPETAPNPLEQEEIIKPKPTEVKQPIRNSEDQKLVNPKSWFIKKLQEIDKRLFDYKPKDGDKSAYSRQCAGNDDRQPSVLTQDQYERMREIYEDDPIFWIIYPLLDDTEPLQPLGTEETVTLMRYGSDANNIRYYFCPQYYCLSDEIMIRKKDFESTRDREGNPKAKDSCPFCYGTLITDKKAIVPGHTVIKRKDKKGSTTHHKYMGFMSKSGHPENFALPCCFVMQSTELRIDKDPFAHIRSSLQELAVENEINNTVEDKEYDDEPLVRRMGKVVEYAVLFETIHKEYILEPNKHPDAGVFATISPQFDAFFNQNSDKNMVTRVTIQSKLRPNAQGFLRIGTENTPYESLLGVLAPLLYKNSIEEVKERILEVVVPRIFLNAHFGNLVLEFFHPEDGRAMPATKQELMLWSQTHLGIAVNSINLYPLIRIYNAYNRFVRFIKNPTERKDLRHIQPLLAEPGLFTTKGLQLIVMEDNGAEPITIKCPVFGVSIDRHRKNDIAFISRSVKNNIRYELYIHTSNKPAKGGESEIHETIVRWNYASRRIWPDIVQKRVDEYMNQCQSRYRSIYTSHSGINSMAMIPLSKAIDPSPFLPEGIIKDSYNHIVGLTFRKPGSMNLIALPVVDDGVISISMAFSIKSIYLDWDDFKAAAVEDVVNYYREHLESLFSLYPGYRIKYIARRKDDQQIAAVQLENGIYIPVSPPKNESSLAALGLKIVTLDQLEWMIDKQLAGIPDKTSSNDWDTLVEGSQIEKRCGRDVELARKSSYMEFEELYQQFRLMVSNWIVSSKGGSGIRKGIEEIIFNSDYPEYERRKRLYIFLSSTLLSWFYPDEESWESGSTSFLRKDCRVIDSPEACSGTCYWKEDAGKCLLHVPATTDLSNKQGEREVSTPELFTKRIIDELVRFPNRRKQLRSGTISKVAAIIYPIHQVDQYIIPESSPTWTNLLQMDWAKQTIEEAKYYEEMSKEPDDSDITVPEGLELKELLGEDSNLRVRILEQKDPSKPLLPFTSILGISLGGLGLNENATIFGKEQLITYVRKISKPIGMINLIELSDDDKNIQFVKPFIGSFDKVMILVFLPNAIGVLIEENGNPEVKLASLPERIQERWKSAGLVQKNVERKQVEEVEPVAPVLIGQNPLIRKPRKPLVAQAAQVAQVAQAAVEPALSIIPSVKRKPRVRASAVMNE